MAIVVGPARRDDGSDGPVARAHFFNLPVKDIEHYRLVHIRGELTDDHLAEVAERLLIDPVGQWWSLAADHTPEGLVIETGLRPGVTDREGAELVRSAAELGLPIDSATIATRFVIDGELEEHEIEALSRRVLHNEVIERWAVGDLPAAFTDADASAAATTTIVVRDLDHEGLAEVNRSRRLGLDPEEMVAIRDHFVVLDRDPTDAELETLAQTWSEHCAHKTFRARVTIERGDGSTEEIDGLLSTLR